MKLIRKILTGILGVKGFIKLASKVYLALVQKGFLKKQYPELFFLNEIVNKDFTCIDIGANVGYYSTIMSKLVGDNGEVHAVEPIPMFVDIWKKNVKRSKISNIKMYQ